MKLLMKTEEKGDTMKKLFRISTAFIMMSVGLLCYFYNNIEQTEKLYEKNTKVYEVFITNIQNEDCDSAFESFNKMVKIYPTSYLPYYELGQCYRKKNDLIHAEPLLDQAIKMNPFIVKSPGFSTEYGILLANNGKTEKGKAFLKEALLEGERKLSKDKERTRKEQESIERVVEKAKKALEKIQEKGGV